MSVFITGAGGQLGQELTKLYPDAHAPTHEELDITDQQQLEAHDWSDVDTIFNAAAYTNVDGAETDGKAEAWAVNRDGVRNLGKIATEHGITLLHVSTDYVFDGTKKGPYQETDQPNPLSEYGRSKLAGEQALADVPDSYIVRTSWVIGQGGNFVRTMLKLGQDLDELTIVDDQIGRPTFAKDLAAALKHLRDTEAEPGIYNFSNGDDPVSWRGLAEATFKISGIDCEAKPTTTEEYFKDKPEAATRPLNSTFDLSKIKATGIEIRPWRKALEEYLSQE